jgi:dTDP-4-dehydrorhamnose reductase
VKVLVFGAGGMLAHDVVRAASYTNHEVGAMPRSELDVTDLQAVGDAVAEALPDAVVNCAGYTNVDAAEDEPGEALRVNGEAAGIVAAAAARAGASALYVSSDYVFDGAKGYPYVESDRPAPLSAYGHSKLAGEAETAAANRRHFVVRSAWLFGSGRGNFVETMLDLAEEHGEVIVVRDQVGSPTYTAHLADALVRLISTEAYGLHHIAGGGECSWYEFALAIFEAAGVDCRVLSCTTDEFPRPATRPAYSALGTELEQAILLPEWRDGLRSYLAERVRAP